MAIGERQVLARAVSHGHGKHAFGVRGKGRHACAVGSTLTFLRVITFVIVPCCALDKGHGPFSPFFLVYPVGGHAATIQPITNK
jgi:hypothetical protein